MPAPSPIERGAVFGQLTVLRHSKRKLHYVCRCSCGRKKDVRKDHLRGGKIVSCGCVRNAASSERARAGVMTAAATTHGASKTRAYSSWLAMRQRCWNKKSTAFHYYGGRGIGICKRWESFPNFLADMGQPGVGQEIDRKDNDGNYEPGNCHWVSRSEQQNNRRVNRRVTLDGVTKTIAEWSRSTGIHHNTISQRLDNGTAPAVALARARIPCPSKLTADDVRAIRAATDERGSALALRYGVTHANICAIRSRKSWKHLKPL